MVDIVVKNITRIWSLFNFAGSEISNFILTNAVFTGLELGSNFMKIDRSGSRQGNPINFNLSGINLDQIRIGELDKGNTNLIHIHSDSTEILRFTCTNLNISNLIWTPSGQGNSLFISSGAV